MERSLFLDCVQIRDILTVFFLIIVCFSTKAVEAGTIETVEGQNDGHNATSWSNSSNVHNYSDDKLKELRIEMVKFHILSKLNLKKPPATAPSTQSDSQKEMIEILLNEETQPQRHSIDIGERLLIHPRNRGVNCSQFNESYCRTFKFEISATLNSSSLDLWIYRTDEKSEEHLSLSIFCTNGREKMPFHRVFHDVQKSGWNKVELPRIVLPGSWNNHFYYVLTVSGAEIKDHGDRRLFLMVTKSSLVVSRKSRDVSCDSSDNCCLKPLLVTFSKIGFDWILYPEQMEVNMCTGKCIVDHSKMKTHYERVVAKVLENNSSLIESLGVCWTRCCKPKEMKAERVIYNDSDGIIHDQYIPDLTVKSCSCS